MRARLAAAHLHARVRLNRTLAASCACAPYACAPTLMPLCLCDRPGSVKAEAAVKAAVSSENVAPRKEVMPNKLEGVPVATPSFLPPEALRALAARGIVGSVACILDA